MLEKRFYFQFDDMKKNSENFQQNKKFNWIYIIKKTFESFPKYFVKIWKNLSQKTHWLMMFSWVLVVCGAWVIELHVHL
jgi:hypothetical protein